MIPAEMGMSSAVGPADLSVQLLLLIEAVLKLLYFVGLFGLAVYGLNSLITTLLYWRTRKRRRAAGSMADWPPITVQLPIYNERYTIERLLAAVASLDYPRQRLQIQILDDSTDDTAQLTRQLAEEYRARGLNIVLQQRADRRGFKAGALADGMRTATGELLAVFDADFIPPRDWLKRTVIYFGSDPKLACVQTRWGHVNQNYSAFTSAQALGMDGHFIVEQAARASNGLFLNFNGTAGVWRRAAIEDAGGWQPDTLTEDLDLSYRAQLRGWHIEYLPQVVVPAEIPVQVEAFKKQQFRWAKGSFQVVRKLFADLMQARAPLGKRILGFVHITGYCVHPLMIAVLLLVLPVGLLAPHFLMYLWWMAIM
jgi:cellulose synthase/poly-beta-1,6-N-acetylglucosamine synthase-like glycosyltransferase